MAIINSLGIGAGAKSAGNITYAHYRGRTIAKQRITENKSNTAAQEQQRMRFAQVEYLCRGFRNFLPNFAPTKYGFRSNRFIKVNYKTLAEYVIAHDDWNETGTPVGAAIDYITSLMPDDASAPAVYKMPLYSAFDLRREFTLQTAALPSPTYKAVLYDPWHKYKSVVMRSIRITPTSAIPLITDEPLTYDTEVANGAWSGTHTPVANTVATRPLYAVTLIIDGKPSSSFYVAQTPYTKPDEQAEALEIQEAPPALSARRRVRK